MARQAATTGPPFASARGLGAASHLDCRKSLKLIVAAFIPPKSSRIAPMEYDKEMYKWRHLIENFFQKIKRSEG